MPNETPAGTALEATPTAPQVGTPSAQAAEAANPQAAAPAALAATPPAGTPAEDPKNTDLQREAQSLRKRLRDAEAKIAETANAGMSEQEKQAKRVSELEAQLAERDQRLRGAEVRALAAGRNVVDPEAVERLLDWKRVDDGEPLSKVFEDLVKAKPWLIQGAPSLGPTNPGQQTGLTVEALRGMSAAQIAAYDKAHPGEIDRLIAKS